MLFPKTLALIMLFAPLVHLQPLEVSPSDVTNVTDIMEDTVCDCDYKETGQGGCVISEAARPGRACRCILSRWGHMCFGEEVECLDPTSPSCQSGGDTSLLACQQGGGNCGGYVNNEPDLFDLKGCDCDYEETGQGGCVISQAARPGRACRCFLYSKIAPMCLGKEVECLDVTSPSCQNRGDMSLLACQQGGGNCLGYVNDDTDIFDLKGCDCEDTGLGGCVISRAARPGRACKCFLYPEVQMCRGKEVKCIAPKMSSCRSGYDKSLEACLQGRGNCLGYAKFSNNLDENGSDGNSRDEETVKPIKILKNNNPM